MAMLELYNPLTLPYSQYSKMELVLIQSFQNTVVICNSINKLETGSWSHKEWAPSSCWLQYNF